MKPLKIMGQDGEESIENRVEKLEKNDVFRGHVLLVVAVFSALIGGVIMGILWWIQLR